MLDVAILSIARTPCGRAHKGSLRDTRPDSLAAHCIDAALKRAPGVTPEAVGDVVLGCAMPEAEQGMNVARIASVIADIPDTVPAMTVNRLCASGLQSIATAAGRIALGEIEIALAGGVESMTMVPLGGHRPSPSPALLAKRPGAYMDMGATAEQVASRFKVSRETQDEFAYRSHMRAAAAQKADRFAEQIVEVATRVRTEEGKVSVTLSHDETVRSDTSLEALAQLKPVFSETGSVTAGNSSPLTDGAACAVLSSRDVAERLGITPLGILRQFVTVGVPPEIMGIGPVPAVKKLLEMTQLKLEDIDLFEINEAFAAQAAYCERELGIDPARLNPNGGSIALGHPLGATGAILTAKTLYELNRIKGRYGVVSMCVGGGMGAAALFERVG